jgi:hypothetical protein
MMTLPTPQPGTSRTGQLRPPSYDFAVLGLSSREARVEAIRDAAQRRAKSIQGSSELVADQRRDLLGELATSTYRVLDPRRRSKMMERVQLCLLTDCDYELQQRAHTPFSPGGAVEPFVLAELLEVEANHEAQLRQAKREIVRYLLQERSKSSPKRVGGMMFSLLVASLLTPAIIAAAVFF